MNFSVGERGRVTKHAKTKGILVRVVEDSSDVAAVVKLLTYIASYVSQWHEKRIEGKTFERVVEGSSDVAAAVKLLTYIASYGSQ